MKIGVIGLGKMGQQIVARLVAAGHEVVALDPDLLMLEQAEAAGAQKAANRDDLVQQLGAQPVVWVMIPAHLVESELEALYAVLPPESVVIDGGNSDYRDTITRAEGAISHRVSLVDVGTSGGVHGLEEGFSMMVGGTSEAVAVITPIIEALAQPYGWKHFGPAGAGHFVKMVHNGIEYGLMQAYGEGYRVLKENRTFPELNLADIAEVWQNGSIVSSQLNKLAAEILAHDQEFAQVEGVVTESGEARWTLETAKAEGIDMPVIQAAFDVRLDSQQRNISYTTKFLAALRNAFGGHAINPKKPE